MAAELMQCYEDMASASRAMLEAARGNDWPKVASLEKKCAGMIADLGREAGAMAAALDDAQRRRRLEIVQRLLAEDAEIRNLAQPWLVDVQCLLGRHRARDESHRRAFLE